MKKLLIPILLWCCSACHPGTVFEEYEKVPEENWNRYQVVEFTAEIPDSTYYRVSLCLRHTTDYEMANLWCFVSTRSVQGKPLKDTVNLKIAEPDGRWLGKGGAIKTLVQPINRNPVLLPAGKITFCLEQGMRKANMAGIKDVGLRIEKVKK